MLDIFSRQKIKTRKNQEVNVSNEKKWTDKMSSVCLCPFFSTFFPLKRLTLTTEFQKREFEGKTKKKSTEMKVN